MILKVVDHQVYTESADVMYDSELGDEAVAFADSIEDRFDNDAVAEGSIEISRAPTIRKDFPESWIWELFGYDQGINLSISNILKTSQAIFQTFPVD